MGIEKITGAIGNRKAAVAAAALGVAAIGGLAWALSTGPLVPVGTAAGSTAGSGPAAAATGSAPAGPSGSSDSSAEGAADAAGEPKADDREDAGEAADSKAKSDEGGKKAEPAKGEGGKGQASSKNPSKPGQGGTGSSSSGSSGSGSSGSGSSGSASSGSGSSGKPQAPKPSHQHSWTAVYRTEPVYAQQWVSKWEDVFVKRQERYRCTTCGATYYSLGEMNAHLDSTIDWDTMTGHAGYLDDSYDVWEKRDNGSYQTVQTGTKQVLDHYECSCGKTK